MGACSVPNVSIFYSYVSLIPYMLIFALIALSLIKRKYSYLRITTALAIAYVMGERPEFSCKSTYGMPSSHMTVMVGFTYWIFESCQNTKNKNFLILKIFLLISCLVQGIARYQLNYHTVPQIIGGIIFGIYSVLILFKIIDKIYFKNKDLILRYLPIVDDSNQNAK